MKMFVGRNEKPCGWIQDLMTKLCNNQIGNFIVNAGSDLSKTDKEQKPSPEALVRQSYRRLVDRLLIVFIIGNYAYMWDKFAPEGVSYYPDTLYIESVY
jgi:hypothetical protein